MNLNNCLTVFHFKLLIHATDVASEILSLISDATNKKFKLLYHKLLFYYQREKCWGSIIYILSCRYIYVYNNLPISWLVGSVLLTCILDIWPWPIFDLDLCDYNWYSIVFMEHCHLHAVFLFIVFNLHIYARTSKEGSTLIFVLLRGIYSTSFLFQIVYSLVHISTPKLYIPQFKYFCTFTFLKLLSVKLLLIVYLYIYNYTVYL